MSTLIIPPPSGVTRNNLWLSGGLLLTKTVSHMHLYTLKLKNTFRGQFSCTTATRALGTELPIYVKYFRCNRMLRENPPDQYKSLQ